MSACALQAEGLGYKLGERTLFEGVELRVEAGELVVILGESGSGKTTLLSLLGALDSRFVGEVRVAGQALSGLKSAARARLRNAQIGFVFQSFHLLEHLSLSENLCLAGWLAERPKAEAALSARAEDLLSQVGLQGRGAEQVSKLSGGERQRVAIARALMNEPPLILADEPTGNLDVKTSEAVLDLLSGLAKDKGAAVVIATHDRVVARRASRCLALEGGALVPAGEERQAEWTG